MLDKLVSNDFNEFVNYALTNFTLNMLKRGGYNRKNDERTFFFFFVKSSSCYLNRLLTVLVS